MTELNKIINSSNIDSEKSEYVLQQFNEFAAIASEWESKAKSIIVTDESQTELMSEAREARLLLKSKRVEIEKRRKALKEQSLREGQLIDSVAKYLKELIEPSEKHLELQEKYAEIKTAERKAELERQRSSKLSPFAEFVPSNIRLSELSEEDFMKLLSGAKVQHEAKIEAEKKAELERIEKEKKEAAERERIRIENEKLKKEAAEREKQIAIEKRKAAEAEKQRNEAAAKLQAAQAELQKNEEQSVLNESTASDSEKILQLIQQLKSIKFYDVKTAEAKEIIVSAELMISKVITRLKEYVNSK